MGYDPNYRMSTGGIILLLIIWFIRCYFCVKCCSSDDEDLTESESKFIVQCENFPFVYRQR